MQEINLENKNMTIKNSKINIQVKYKKVYNL